MSSFSLEQTLKFYEELSDAIKLVNSDYYVVSSNLLPQSITDQTKQDATYHSSYNAYTSLFSDFHVGALNANCLRVFDNNKNIFPVYVVIENCEYAYRHYNVTDVINSVCPNFNELLSDIVRLALSNSIYFVFYNALDHTWRYEELPASLDHCKYLSNYIKTNYGVPMLSEVLQ